MFTYWQVYQEILTIKRIMATLGRDRVVNLSEESCFGRDHSPVVDLNSTHLSRFTQLNSAGYYLSSMKSTPLSKLPFL